MSTEIPIPNVALTRQERATALSRRISERYPNIESVSVTVSQPFGSVDAGTYIPGGYRVEAVLADGLVVLNYDDGMTSNKIMSSIFATHAVEFGWGALEYENSVDVVRDRRAALLSAIVDARAAMIVTRSATPPVSRVTLEALLAAAEREASR